MHTQSRQTDRSVLCMFPLTEPQLPHVFEPPAIAALHFGQVLCIFACRGVGGLDLGSEMEMRWVL